MAFFNQLTRRSLSQSAVMSAVIKNVTVIGSGLMGAGIAQVAAQSGHKVTMVDLDKEIVKKAEQKISASVQKAAKKKFGDNNDDAVKFTSEVLERLSTSTDAVAAVKGADLVIEAIVENLDAKKTLFVQLDPVAPQHTIFASNTSALSITEISEATQRKDRFGGLHFFNPVPIMKLLEVVRTPDTSLETFDAMMAFGKAMGKVTVQCKDNVGFIVNRLLMTYMSDAIKMLEKGDASKEDIDVAIKLGLGYPMGPLELMDFVGLDTCLFAHEQFERAYPDNPTCKPANLLRKMVSEGKLGVKTGEGFFKYKK